MTLSFWESDEAIKGLAGEDTSRAVSYPDDDPLLTNRCETVEHYRLFES